MKSFLNILLILAAAAVTVSCDSIRYALAGNTVDATFKHTSRLTDPLTGKEVILVPMGHIGSEQGYARVKSYLDGLKADGFVCFFEGVVGVPYHIDTVSEVTYPQLKALCRSTELSRSDSLRLDTLERKLRRLLGVSTSMGYTAAENRSVPARYRKGKKIAQSKENTGVTSDRDIWIDYSLGDLIALYEQQCGKIPLTEYDFETPLGAKYEVKSHRDIYGIGRHFRDKYLLKRILGSPHAKIAVVYGLAHTHNIKRDLRYLYGYMLDEKYKTPKR